MNAEKFVDEPVVDERARVEFFAERQPEVFYLGNGQRQRGREMSQHTVDSIGRNLPDAEESQHVVDADGVEILLHVVQAATEPLDQFRSPMIGRESPVLALLREDVGWGTGRCLHVEQFRMLARFHTVATDTDGQIAFQYDTLRTGIVCSVLQLSVQQILHEIDVVQRNRRHLIMLDDLGFPPFCVRLQPILIVCDKCLVFSRLQCFLTLFLEECHEVFVLHAVNGFIVAIGQGVQFLTATLELRHRRLGTQGTCGLQVHIMWMKSAGADDVVWVGIVPVAIGRGVVDGQQLYDLHTRLCGPIDHSAQIAEVANAIRLFAA